MKNIIADFIDIRKIYIKCPNYKKCNGIKFHTHGNAEGRLENQILGRVSHCKFLDYENIIIDNSTIRKLIKS